MVRDSYMITSPHRVYRVKYFADDLGTPVVLLPSIYCSVSTNLVSLIIKEKNCHFSCLAKLTIN